jgi:catechol 2,3-dioxygenase-like lactoylglutathione lyase family enzyme
MIKGIEHTALAALDATKLAAWYESVPGFAVVHRSSNAIFLKASDGSMTEIIHAEGESSPQTMKTPGIRHLALMVSDLESVYTTSVRERSLVRQRAKREQGK